MMISGNIHSQYKENSVPGALECFPMGLQPRGPQGVIGHEQSHHLTWGRWVGSSGPCLLVH